jgi:hypothetical protein
MSDYHFDFHIQGERAEHYIKHVAIPCGATRSTSGLKVSGVAQLQADHSESATSVQKASLSSNAGQGAEKFARKLRDGRSAAIYSARKR